ncbi:MAG TPA: universal stress protein [Planctomycetota bacterium]|nr:universal stress protein [Planctomycetota bacterium]
MITFKNVVLTTDLSLNADAAVPYAAALAKQSGGTIHLFHAFEEDAREALASGIVIGVSAWIESVRKAREQKVADLAQAIERQRGVKTIYATAVGNPANEIARYAKHNNADAVVLATHGRTGLSHLLMGSVAERVVRLCPSPVLTVRPGEAPPADGFKFKTILLPTDFSENSCVAEPYAVELAQKNGATLVLAHVVEDSVYYASAAASEGIGVDIEKWLTAIWADAEKQLRANATRIAAQTKLDVVPVLKRGRAAEQIGQIAKEQKADLMVLSTHGYTGLSHLIFGSVAERIVRTSPVPVMSIKPGKK